MICLTKRPYNPPMTSFQPKPQPRKKPRGRAVMFAGTRVKMTIKVTERAWALIQSTQATLRSRHGAKATEGAAVEYLIRKATRTRLGL